VSICVFFSIGFTLGSSPLSPAYAATTPTARAVVHKLIRLINKDRAAHHVGPLVLDRVQSTCSLRHAKHMAAQDFISHDDFPSDVCTPHVYAGENVGEAGGNPLAGATALHQEMMAEGPCPDAGCPNGEFEQHGHYLNLINRRYTRVGIGVCISRGQIWVTEDFTDGHNLR
jgi:uncharacterized protein YkwD